MLRNGESRMFHHCLFTVFSNYVVVLNKVGLPGLLLESLVLIIFQAPSVEAYIIKSLILFEECGVYHTFSAISK